jgi:hypothetical protein
MTADQFRNLALAIPGAIESSHGNHPDFRMGGKVFASLGAPDDDHGVVKFTPEQQQAYLESDPDVFTPCVGAWGRQGFTSVLLAAVKVGLLRAALEAAAKNVTAKRKSPDLASPRRIPMPNLIQSLFAAIIDDDRTRVKVSLKSDPSLAKSGTAGDERFDANIAHWIYTGDTALHIAAAGYRVEIARLLLAAGADPRAAKNRRAAQPLHYAADGYLENPAWDAARQVAMIRLLLESGAAIDAQDKNGANPLHRAVRTRCAAAVQCLLAAGAAPTLRNKPGSTPFHLAVQNTGRGGSGAEQARTAQREILQAFLDHGVSPNIKDAKGKSVLDWAKSDWIRQMLLGHAA